MEILYWDLFFIQLYLNSVLIWQIEY